VSGEDASGRGAGGGRGADGDDAVWRDLIARFDMPDGEQPDAAPWPDRESLTPPGVDQESAGQLPGADRARVIRPAAPSPAGPPAPLPPAGAANGTAGPAADERAGERADAGDADPAGASTADDLGEDDAFGSHRASPYQATPYQAPPYQVNPHRADPDRADDAAEEHFVPPPPPPLPHLDSVAKGAWTALFGGPAYLLWATLMGWTIPGWAALLAVVAFVGGFAVVVLRLGDRPSDGAGPDDDDGAVL
jgi:hypothetical protein